MSQNDNISLKLLLFFIILGRICTYTQVKKYVYAYKLPKRYTYFNLKDVFFLWRLQPNRGLWPPHFLRFFEITHNDTPQSVGLLWTSDQPVSETST